MPKIETGIYANLLRRILRMKGTTHVADELAPEVVATLPVDNIQSRPDWQFLKGWKLMAGNVRLAVPGGATGTIRMRVPVDSGIMVILEQVGFTFFFAAGSVPTFTVFMAVDQGDLAIPDTAGPAGPLDTRLRAGTSVIWSRELTTGFGRRIHRVTPLAPSLPTPRVILHPGSQSSGFPGNQMDFEIINPGGTLGQFDVNAWWLEKPLDRLEADD